MKNNEITIEKNDDIDKKIEQIQLMAGSFAGTPGNLVSNKDIDKWVNKITNNKNYPYKLKIVKNPPEAVIISLEDNLGQKKAILWNYFIGIENEYEML